MWLAFKQASSDRLLIHQPVLVTAPCPSSSSLSGLLSSAWCVHVQGRRCLDFPLEAMNRLSRVALSCLAEGNDLQTQGFRGMNSAKG